jgi:hypothetical protein
MLSFSQIIIILRYLKYKKYLAKQKESASEFDASNLKVILLFLELKMNDTKTFNYFID